jgi:phosphotriesterase-related protein
MKMTHPPATVSRRHALRLLGLGAGAGLVTALGQERWTVAALLQPTSPARMAAIPRGAIIRTILKDLSPEALGNGAILFHEHLSFGSDFFERMRPPNAPRPSTPPPPSYLTDPDIVTDEVRATGRDGVSCIVDGGHADMGTDYENLRKIAERSGVHIVASGGYYLQILYPPEVATQSEDQLVERLVQDAATKRWGAFGEIGSSEEMTTDERKVFRVIAKAQLRTGLPVFTHTSHAGCKKCALDQLDILESAGANPRSLCIGHLSDIRDDSNADTHKEIARRGAYVGFDTVGHQLAQGDAKKVAMILKVLDAGYEDHILLSSDFASDRETKLNGGAGYSSVTAVFLPKLRYAGVKEATIHRITVENPKRFLAFVPKSPKSPKKTL